MAIIYRHTTILSRFVAMILTTVVVLLHTQTTFASKAALVDCASTECVVNMGDRLFPCSSTLFGIEMGFGTLGGFFESKDMPNNERTFYAITNAHVVASGDEDEKSQEEMIGVDICTSNFVLGKVAAYNHNFDTAFVQIDSNVKVNCNLPSPPNEMYNIGELFLQQVVQLPLVRDECERVKASNSIRRDTLVMKYGARTGWTQSFGARFPQSSVANVQIRNIDTMSYFFGERKSVPTKKDFMENHFSSNGDSGSLILDSGLNAVAILIGSGGHPKKIVYKEQKKDEDEEETQQGFLSWCLWWCDIEAIKTVIDRLLGEGEPLEWILAHDLHKILQSDEVRSTIGEVDLCRTVSDDGDDDRVVRIHLSKFLRANDDAR